MAGQLLSSRPGRNSNLQRIRRLWWSSDCNQQLRAPTWQAVESIMQIWIRIKVITGADRYVELIYKQLQVQWVYQARGSYGKRVLPRGFTSSYHTKPINHALVVTSASHAADYPRFLHAFPLLYMPSLRPQQQYPDQLVRIHRSFYLSIYSENKKNTKK